MDKITSQKYTNECTQIARDAVNECEGDEERIHDYLHESIDGHQWIIYTYYAMQVLEHSRNENAYFDNYGKPEAEDFSSTMAQLAFAAMMADVQECLSAELEKYREEQAS